MSREGTMELRGTGDLGQVIDQDTVAKLTVKETSTH